MNRERRAHPRFPVQLAVRYRGEGLRGLGRRGDGLVTNLSKGGLLVALASRRFALRTRVMLELDGMEESCRLSGVVVRVDEMGFAIRFCSTEPEQAALLESLLRRAAAAERLDEPSR